jgi:uncharacterized protein
MRAALALLAAGYLLKHIGPRAPGPGFQDLAPGPGLLRHLWLCVLDKAMIPDQVLDNIERRSELSLTGRAFEHRILYVLQGDQALGHIRQEQKGKPIDLCFNAQDIQRTVLMRHFSCHECGECCRQEAERLARRSHTSLDRFVRKYLARDTDPEYAGLFRMKHGEGGYCKFYVPGKGCGIYEARPGVCRAYPFFSQENLMKPYLVQYEACPGACKTLDRFQRSQEMLEGDRLVRMFRFLEERFGLIAGEQILRMGEIYYIQGIMGQDVTYYLLQISCELSEMMKAAREAGFEVVAPAPGGKLRLVI